MLPRLRFVVAAVIIAALPWCVFNSGLVTDLPNSSIAEYSRQSAPTLFGGSDLHEARQIYLMSYVRRSHELERLRDLATAPLSEWIIAPSGGAEPPSPVAYSGESFDEKPTEVAALPAAAVVAAPIIVESETGERMPLSNALETAQQTSIGRPTENEPVVTRQAALDLNRPVESSFVPPLPRVRPHPSGATVKRRHHRPRYVAPPPPPLPSIFAGPPATPTASISFAQRYGYPAY